MMNREFDESQVNRDTGKFATTPGASAKEDEPPPQKVSLSSKESRAKLTEFYDEAFAEPTKSRTRHITTLDNATTENLSKAGRDFTGYSLAADTSHMRHIDNRHGPNAKQMSRNALPVGSADIAKIPDILATGKATLSPPRNRGLLGIEINQGGKPRYHLICEVREGKKQIIPLSLSKYPK